MQFETCMICGLARQYIFDVNEVWFGCFIECFKYEILYLQRAFSLLPELTDHP